MCMYLRTETQVCMCTIWSTIFFLTLTVTKKREKIMGGTELFSEKTEAVHSELNERAKAATSSYYAAVGFWYYIYSVFVTKNH